MRLRILVVLLFLFFSFFGMQAGAQETISIVCTNSVLADFTSEIITENVTIEYIMPAGACPAHFDTCPSDIQLIAGADIIVSLGWEPWLTSILEASENKDVAQIKCSQLGEWCLPSNAIDYVNKIRDELIILLPSYNVSIHESAQEYIAEINDTAEQLRQIIESNGCLGKKVICMQWQKDFVESLGLNITFSYGPPEGLSTQDILNVSNVAAAGDIVAIIDNLQSGTEFGGRIASESGASHVIFTNFPGAVPGADTYLEVVTYNTQQLINGIATYEYKKGDIANLEGRLNEVELQRNATILVAVIFVVLACILVIMYKKK